MADPSVDAALAAIRSTSFGIVRYPPAGAPGSTAVAGLPVRHWMAVRNHAPAPPAPSTGTALAGNAGPTAGSRGGWHGHFRTFAQAGK